MRQFIPQAVYPLVCLGVLSLTGCFGWHNLSYFPTIRQQVMNRRFMVLNPKSFVVGEKDNGLSSRLELHAGSVVRVTNAREFVDLIAFPKIYLYAQPENDPQHRTILFATFFDDARGCLFNFDEGSPLPKEIPSWLDVAQCPPSASRATDGELSAALSSDDWAVRHHAIRELAVRATTSDRAVADLAIATKDPVWRNWILVLDKAKLLGPRATPLVSAIFEGLERWDYHDNDRVLAALKSIGPAALPDTVNFLSRRTEAGGFFPDYIVADMAEAYPMQARPFYDQLLQEYTRRGSVDSYVGQAMLAADRKRAKEYFSPIAVDADQSRSWSAIYFMIKIYIAESNERPIDELEIEARPLVEAICRGLKTDDFWLADLTLFKLRDLGPIARSALPTLKKLLESESPIAKKDHKEIAEAIENIEHGKPGRVAAD